MELLKDYDMSMLYHPGKANVVDNALSRVTMGSIVHIEAEKKELAKEVHRLAIWVFRLKILTKAGPLSEMGQSHP